MTKDKEKTLYTVCTKTVPNTATHINKPIILDDPLFEGCESEFTLSRNQQSRKWNHLQIASETKRLKYRAVNFGERSAATLPYKYAIAVVDTKANKAQIFDAELFVCSRIIKNLENTSIAPHEESAVKSKEETNSDYLKSRLLLGESFGTKKTKQIISASDRNKIDIELLATQSDFISKNLDSSISRIEIQKRDEDDSSPANTKNVASADSILPTHNSKTKKVHEIYRVQDLIPHQAYLSMDVSLIVEAIKSRNEVELSKVTSPYILHETVDIRLKSIINLGDGLGEKSITHTVRCLLYLNYLLAFQALNESKVNGDLSSFLPMATSEIVTALLGQFADVVTIKSGKHRYKISSLYRDRLIVYICILTLLLDGFRTNVARLSVVLQQSLAKTTNYLRAIGCVLDKPTDDEPTKYVAPITGREIQVKMAVLKAPLTIMTFKARTSAPKI